RLRSSLDYEELLISEAGGMVVSKLIERFLIEKSVGWKLESNGAAIKGKSQRPVRVPDGLEVKTCKGPFAVDCHHAHAGLHLVVRHQRRP
ncbi:MAG: hypothetical protein ACKN9U_22900, partial [Pirellulaceae bacterium]